MNVGRLGLAWDQRNGSFVMIVIGTVTFIDDQAKNVESELDD